MEEEHHRRRQSKMTGGVRWNRKGTAKFTNTIIKCITTISTTGALRPRLLPGSTTPTITSITMEAG